MRVTDLPWWYHRVRANEDPAERQAFCKLAVYAHGSDGLYAKVRYRNHDVKHDDALMACRRSIPHLIGTKLLGTTQKAVLTVYASAFSDAETLDEFMWQLDHEEGHAKEDRDNAAPPGYEERNRLLSLIEQQAYVSGPGLDEKLLLTHLTQWERSWSECNAYLADMANEKARVIRPELLVDTISNYLAFRVQLDAYNAMFLDNPVLNGLLGTTREPSTGSNNAMIEAIYEEIKATTKQEPPRTSTMLKSTPGVEENA